MNRTAAVWITCCTIIMASMAAAVEPLRTIEWTSRQDWPAGVEVFAGVGFGHDAGLRITAPGSAPFRATLLTIENPGITGESHALNGQIRYQDVQGPAYLEMWSHYSDGSRYYSRTMATAGPMQRIEGSSGWRYLSVPFLARGTKGSAQKLVLNVIMPGRGTIELSPLTLMQFGPGEDPLRALQNWWPDWLPGILSGAGGLLLGLAGALVGALAGTGRARGFVLGLMLGGIIAGAIFLVLGIAAVVAGEAYAIYYPLLLGGGLALVLFLPLRPLVRRRYDELELRRMRAQDTA